MTQHRPVERKQSSGTAPREGKAQRIAWERLRRDLRVKSMWGVPFRLFCAGLAAGLLVPLVDRLLAALLPAYPALDADGLAGILSMIAGAMMTLTGLVFGALSAAMSLGVTSLSVRVAPVFQEDGIIRWGLGTFMATFIYCLVVAVSIMIGGDSTRPWVSGLLAVVAAVLAGVMLIAVVVRVCQHLNPGTLLRRLASDGFHGLSADPVPFHRGAHLLAPATADAHHDVRRQARLAHGDSLLAVDVRRLLDLSDAWGLRISLVPKVGSAVPFDGVVIRTDTPVTDDQADQLRQTLAWGDAYSPSNGPFGAMRTMVNIALKALSPAVNDPSRAVQALDRIEDLLARMSPVIARQEEELRNDPASEILRSWARDWESYVAAGTDEIRQFGTTSVQIQRRLRALFATLLELCPPEQEPPLRERLEALDRGLDWWPDGLDRHLATVPDPQGIGAPAHGTRVL